MNVLAAILTLWTVLMTGAERYVAAAAAAGCPADQIENFARAGIILQEKQLAFAAAARLCDRPGGPVKIGFGGARCGGKSHVALSQVGADDCMRHPGLKALLLRKVGGSVKESFEGLLPKTIGGLGNYVPSEGIFRFPHNGSSIRLGHFQHEKDIDKHIGNEYDVIAVEEATTISATKMTGIESCCRSPEGSGWRARMYLPTNPGGIGHAWYKSMFVQPFRDGAETRTRFIPSTVDDNAFATPEYRVFLDGLQGWLLRAWRYGDWDIAAGQFFTNFLRELHVANPPWKAIPKHWDTWLAMDYGWVHYTVCHLFARDDDGHVWVVDEHAERRWLPEQHAAGIRAMLTRWGIHDEGRINEFVVGRDALNPDRNGRSTADAYADLGFTMTGADMDRINGWAEVLRRLGNADAKPPIRPTLTITEHCPRLIECLPSLESSDTKPQDVQKVDCDPDGLGGDDAGDCFRYGLMVAAERRQAVITRNPYTTRRV